MRKKMLSMLLCSAMAASILAGCGGSGGNSEENANISDAEATEVPDNTVIGNAEAKDAFVIWGWDDDIKKILDGTFKEDYPEEYKRIVFVNAEGSDFYQGKLDEILNDPGNSLYPDLMGLEADYVLKYVKGDCLLSVDDLGIKQTDYGDQYSYNVDLGTSREGKVKALFWQATPGSWQLRADLCKQYLGTDDPEELQKHHFSSWDKILATAQKLNEDSSGKVKLLSGYTDVFRIFSNARKTGWYDSKDKGESQSIEIDDQMKRYMNVAKQMYEGELTFDTEQWSADWTANMVGDGRNSNAALAYTGCPWFTYRSLGGDGREQANPWIENTILVEGPQHFYWGGTGLAATVGCADKGLAGTIMKYFTCGQESMMKISELNSDFVNNKKAVTKLKNTAECDKLYPPAKQNFMEFYLPLAEGIDTSTVTAEDKEINVLWDAQVKEYVQGTKDEEKAMEDFKMAVHEKYEHLTVE